MAAENPKILVFTHVFPSTAQPRFGSFVRERMFRVGKELSIVVVAPQPWFPFQGLLRLMHPHFRPRAPFKETQEGVEVYHPRYLCVPGILKSLDGILMAISCYLLLRQLRQEFQFDLIDSHFACSRYNSE